SGARAALSTVDRDEVDATARLRHQPCEVPPQLEVADRRLDAHGEPGRVRQELDPVEHRVDVAELRVTRRAHAVASGGNPAGRRDLGAHLRRGEQAPEPRLGALGELDLDRADRCSGDQVLEAYQVEATSLVA